MHDMRISRIPGICLALGLVLMTVGVSTAEIPRKINYQGRISDGETGLPLRGEQDITFRIYDAPVGGILLWSEQQEAEADSAGVFAAILGSVTPIGLSFEGPCWLEVEVDGQVLLPRREIVSVPFAFRSADSDSLDGLGPDAFSLAGHGHEEYVTEGEAASITAEMIADGEISDSDIAEDAAIDPSKIEGGAWTSENDGASSGLDADKLDGLNADAFADSAHTHDGRYYRQTQLNSPGSINQGSNPVDWTRLKNVPSGFADGSDDVGGAGDGHSLDAADGSPVDVVYVDNDGAVAIGDHAEASDTAAVAIGRYVRATVPNSMVIGRGYSPSMPLVNGTRNSLTVGFGRTEPTLFVGGPFGYVGVHTDSPAAPLDTPGPVRIGGSGVIPGYNWGLMIVAGEPASFSVPLGVVDQTGGDLFCVRGTGKVGVGTLGPLTRFHIQTSELGFTDSVFQADVVAVESVDAVLGLYSSAGGAAGSAVTLGEITGEHLVDKWGMVRETTGGGSGLRITYGTDNDQFENDLIMYLDDDGSVGIGTRTTGTYELRVEGEACATGGWSDCSDRIFKKDVVGIGDALAKVLQLRGVAFSWKTVEYKERNFPDGRHFGVIAQEAEEVLPEIVRTGPDGERAVVYTEIIPVLIESIRELKLENEALRQRIEVLELRRGR